MSIENKGTIPVTISVTREPDRSGNLICDGTADDVQIQEAIDYVGGLGGGKVYLGIGTYEIVTTLIDNGHDNVEIIGANPDATILEFAAGRANNFAGFDLDGLADPYIEGWVFRDFTVDGNSANQADNGHFGFYLDYVRHFRFDCVVVKDINGKNADTSTGKGWDGRYVEETHFTNCRWHGSIIDTNNGRNGFAFTDSTRVIVDHCYGYGGSNGVLFFTNTNHSIVADSTFEEFRYGGISIYKDASYNIVSNNTLIGLVGAGSPQGIYIQNDSYPEEICRQNLIIGNTIKGCQQSLIVGRKGTNNIIANNTTFGGHSGAGYGINIKGENNIIIGNTIDGNEVATRGLSMEAVTDVPTGNMFANNMIRAVTTGIQLSDGDDNYFVNNRLTDTIVTSVNISAGDNNVFEQCAFGTPSFRLIQVGAGATNNAFMDVRGDGDIADSGTGTRYSSLNFQFVKEIVGVWLTTSPTGIEVDVDTEGAICLGHLPREIQQVTRLRVWAVALDGPIGAGGQMHAEFTFNAAAGNEAYNLAANSWVLANHDSEEADYVANDVIQWAIEDGDVGNELANLRGGDKFELIVMHEAGADPDGATDAAFGSMEVEYILRPI